MNKSKKLTLNRETLRNLSQKQLEQAHGMTGPARCYPTALCTYTCTTTGTDTGGTNNCNTGSATCQEN